MIGKKCFIGTNTHINDTKINDNTSILSSYINDAVIGKNCYIGPFAYIRPNSVIGENIKIGDFVEIKNSTINNNTKVSHLTYIGDSDVGSNVNFGCGTVTVNYNGSKKFRTCIKDNAFIGCNTNLIAPVTVGDSAYIAAGSTITNNVPDDTLAIARERQTNKINYFSNKDLSKLNNKANTDSE
jgi:bifunctional UDP-N-acetylglucosamine pyrophosphorylase/glucosamine-1-phosphate N-acetyltransferase